MISFFLNVFKLLRATWRAVRRDEEFRILFVLLLVLLASGTYFYWHVEGWSVVDALYFCFMTMSTIGYGDLVPTSPLSKIFTIVYSILTIGLFAAIVTKMVIVTVSAKKRSHARKTEE